MYHLGECQWCIGQHLGRLSINISAAMSADTQFQWCIGQHLGRLSINISAAMSADTQLTLYRDVSRESIDSRPSINQHLGWESFSCRSSVGQQIASVAWQQCIDESLVKSLVVYRLTIGIAYSRSICWPCDVKLSVKDKPTKSTDSRPR